MSPTRFSLPVPAPPPSMTASAPLSANAVAPPPQLRLQTLPYVVRPASPPPLNPSSPPCPVPFLTSLSRPPSPQVLDQIAFFCGSPQRAHAGRKPYALPQPAQPEPDLFSVSETCHILALVTRCVPPLFLKVSCAAFADSSAPGRKQTHAVPHAPVRQLRRRRRPHGLARRARGPAGVRPAPDGRPQRPLGASSPSLPSHPGLRTCRPSVNR